MSKVVVYWLHGLMFDGAAGLECSHINLRAQVYILNYYMYVEPQFVGF